MENSLPPTSPCAEGTPSPAPLVFTPVTQQKSNCLNCEALMTVDHQCEVSDSDWEDVENDKSVESDDQYPLLDLDSEDWAEKFTNSIRTYHGVDP